MLSLTQTKKKQTNKFKINNATTRWCLILFTFVYILFVLCLSQEKYYDENEKTIASYSNELNKHVHNCLITNSLDIELFYS